MLSSRLKAFVIPTIHAKERPKLKIGCPWMESPKPRATQGAATKNWANNFDPGPRRTMSSRSPKANISDARPKTPQIEGLEVGINRPLTASTASQMATPPNLAGVPWCQRSGRGCATHPRARHTWMTTATQPAVNRHAAHSCRISDATLAGFAKMDVTITEKATRVQSAEAAAPI